MDQHYDDALLTLVEELAGEIADDWINDKRSPKVEIEDYRTDVLSGADDDGGTFGRFRIVVNGGRFVIELEASANVYYDGDWEWCSEEQRSVYEAWPVLEDFDYNVTSVREVSEHDINEMIERDIDDAKEASNDH